MVDTARWKYPADMLRDGGESSTLGMAGWAETMIQRGRDFAAEYPEHAVLMALGFGFVLGWKLRRW